jgi:glycopeptide antibiotics resistance protein
MIEITYIQMVIFITAAWILVRLIAAAVNKTFSIKRELLLLLVYVCLIVLSRFVYFPLNHINGKIGTLKIGLEPGFAEQIQLKPFYFIFDEYEGSFINIIGNITMFIPVGIVWPICFKKLNNVFKALTACFGLSLFIELSQLLCYDRHTDIDDLILNTSGALFGILVVFIIRKIKSVRKKEA